jgi:mRNA-degrading endonuclease RelE of RelBE toxin-antitoxin system
MSYNISYSENAEKDAEEASRYYQNIVTGLGLRFLRDLDKTILALEQNPFSFHYYGKNKNIRRANLDVFPYSVYFHVTLNESILVVLAVIHQKRSKSFIRKKLNP